MARLLRHLLGGKEPVFSLRLRSLELSTGGHKVDIKLLSDVLAEANSTIGSLGLDSSDTTPNELYAQLSIIASADDDELRRSFNGDVQLLTAAFIKKAPLTQIPVIKSSRLRSLLSSNPPKKVMSALGFRSTESMIKRAPIDQLLLGAFLLESVKWHRVFAKSLKKLSAADITMQVPQVVIINPRLLKNGRYHHVVALQCAGLVGVPKLAQTKGDFLLTTALISEGLYHLHVRGVLLKLIRFEESCVRELADLTYVGPEPVGHISKIGVPWLSCYLMISKDKQLQETVPEGVVEASDFFWRYPSQVFPLLSKKLNIWGKTTNLGLPDTENTTSLNITDIAHNLYYRVPLSNSTCAAMRRGLNTELISRYVEKSTEKTSILKKLGLA